MSSKKWLAAAIAAVSLTTVAGTSAFALQDGGDGGNGGEGGEGGGASDIDFSTGDVDVNNTGACDTSPAPVIVILNVGAANGETSTSCRGFSGRAGSGRLTARGGNGGRGGAGGGGGRAGDRFTRRSSGGGFPF